MGLLSDGLNPKAQAAGHMPFDGTWRWTECTGCPAAPLHKALGCPQREFGTGTLNLFYEGILHEFDLKARIRSMGYTIVDFGEGGIKHPTLPIYAHPDGLLYLQDGSREILETKSVDEGQDADRFIEEHPWYVSQVQGYQDFVNVDKARIIAKSRKTGYVLPDIVIDRDKEFVKPYYANIVNIMGLLAKGIKSCTGPWAPGCSNDFVTRLFCPYNEVHCASRDSGPATVELDSILSRYAAMKIVLDEYKGEIDGMRMKVEEIMIQAALKSVVSAEGVKAQIQNRRFPSIDKLWAKDNLTQEQFDNIFTGYRNDVLYITIPRALREKGKSDDEDDEDVDGLAP